MPKLTDVLVSPEFKGLNQQEQDQYLQSIGLDRNKAMSITGIDLTPEEPTFIGKLGRSIERGAYQTIKNIAAIPLYGNIESNEDMSAIDPYAIQVYDYMNKQLEKNPTLSKKEDSWLSRSINSAAESAGTSVLFGGPQMAAAALASTGVGAAAGVTASAASFEAMRRSTAVTSYEDLVKDKQQQLGRDLTEAERRDVWEKAAKPAGWAEAGYETLGNVVGGRIVHALAKPAATGGMELLKEVFDKPLSTTVKAAAKGYVMDQPVEQATEILTSLEQDKYGRERIGLQSQFQDSLPEVIGSTLFLGAGMTAGGTALAARSTLKGAKNLEVAKDILFNGYDVSGMTAEQRDNAQKIRTNIALDFASHVKENLGEEAANNFLKNVATANAAALDPNVPSTGKLPFNDSIFSKELRFDTTVQTNQTSDIDVIGSNSNPTDTANNTDYFHKGVETAKQQQEQDKAKAAQEAQAMKDTLSVEGQVQAQNQVASVVDVQQNLEAQQAKVKESVSHFFGGASSISHEVAKGSSYSFSQDPKSGSYTVVSKINGQTRTYKNLDGAGVLQHINDYQALQHGVEQQKLAAQQQQQQVVQPAVAPQETVQQPVEQVVQEPVVQPQATPEAQVSPEAQVAAQEVPQQQPVAEQPQVEATPAINITRTKSTKSKKADEITDKVLEYVNKAVNENNMDISEIPDEVIHLMAESTVDEVMGNKKDVHKARAKKAVAEAMISAKNSILEEKAKQEATAKAEPEVKAEEAKTSEKESPTKKKLERIKKKAAEGKQLQLNKPQRLEIVPNNEVATIDQATNTPAQQQELIAAQHRTLFSDVEINKTLQLKDTKDIIKQIEAGNLTEEQIVHIAFRYIVNPDHNYRAKTRLFQLLIHGHYTGVTVKGLEGRIIPGSADILLSMINNPDGSINEMFANETGLKTVSSSNASPTQREHAISKYIAATRNMLDKGVIDEILDIVYIDGNPYYTVAKGITPEKAESWADSVKDVKKLKDYQTKGMLNALQLIKQLRPDLYHTDDRLTVAETALHDLSEGDIKRSSPTSKKEVITEAKVEEKIEPEVELTKEEKLEKAWSNFLETERQLREADITDERKKQEEHEDALKKAQVEGIRAYKEYEESEVSTPSGSKIIRRRGAKKKGFISNIASTFVEHVQNIFSNKGDTNAATKFTDFIGSDKSVGSTKSIPRSVTGFIEGLHKDFKLSKRVFVLTTADLNSVALQNSTLAMKELYDDRNNYAGVYYSTGNGSVDFIVFNNNYIKNDSQMLSVVSHELGHALVLDHYNNAGVETQDALWGDFQRWLNNIQSGDNEVLKSALREISILGSDDIDTFKNTYGDFFNHINGRFIVNGATDAYGTIKQGQGNLYNQTVSDLFEEYLADQIAKYVRTKEIQSKDSLVVTFFKDLATALKNLYASLSKAQLRSMMPVNSVATWVDSIKQSNTITPARGMSNIQSLDTTDKTKYKRPDVNYIPKSDSMSGILSAFDNMKGFGTDLFKSFKLPFISALKFNDNLEARIAKYVATGMSFDKAFSRAVKEESIANPEGTIARTLLEEHITNNDKAVLQNKLLSDRNGKPVFDYARADYGLLNEKERELYKYILRAGDNNQVVYQSIQDIKEKLNLDVSDATFKAYESTRVAIDNMYKELNIYKFDRALNSILGDSIASENLDEVKKAIVINLYKYFPKTADRISNLREELDKIGVSEDDINDVIGGFAQVQKTLRRTLSLATKGGPVGYIARYRESRIENPWVVRIKERTVTPSKKKDKPDIVRISDRYVTSFDSEREAKAFMERINSDDALRSLFDTETIDPASFKDDSGNLRISMANEVQSEISSLYPTRGSDKRIMDSITDGTIERMEEAEIFDAKAAAKLKKAFLAKTNYDYLRQTNARMLRRKNRGKIRGEMETNPLQTLLVDAASSAAYIARVNSIERMSDFISSLDGTRKLEAIKELKNTYKRYTDSKDGFTKAMATISNTASMSFMMFRGVTAAAQAAQYAAFGEMEMVRAGATHKEAVQMLADNYAKAMLHRFGVSAEEFAQHLKGDQALAKTLRKVLPPKYYKYIINGFENAFKSEKANKSSLYSDRELKMIKEHSDNNDVSDNVTKELNSLEMSMRMGSSEDGATNKLSQLKDGIFKTGMLMFNEMEIVNREASLLTAYNFYLNSMAKEKGVGVDKLTNDDHKLANLKATNFMLRVNGDFSKGNKVKWMRNYPQLAPIFALTSFTFHAMGMVGTRTLEAIGGNRQAAKAVLGFALVSMLLGGAKGEPLWDQLNKLASLMFGKDYLLNLERDAMKNKEGTIEGFFKTIAFRGVPGAIGWDWSNNIAIRLPWVDSIMDLSTGKESDIGMYGAGLSWATGLIKAGKRLYSDPDLSGAARALEDLNLGGISQTVRGYRYYKEGYTTEKGAPIFFGDKQRKITYQEMLKYAAGFKDPSMARTQDVMNAERTLYDGYWKSKREDALHKFEKALDPYLKDGKAYPPSVYNEAIKGVQEYNKALLKDKEARLYLNPIEPGMLVSAIKNRYTPRKNKMQLERQYRDFVNGD